MKLGPRPLGKEGKVCLLIFLNYTFKLLMLFVLIQATLSAFREAFYARCFVMNMIEMTIT